MSAKLSTDPKPCDPADQPSRSIPTTSNYRLTHAKHDPAHCAIPGLFQPLQRGARLGRNHYVEHRYGDVTLAFRCFEPLGADDLRVLQGLLAIAAPIDTHELLTPRTPDPNKLLLREKLELSRSAAHLDILMVESSYYLLAKEIGLTTEGASTYRRIRKNIERLCAVSVIASYPEGIRHEYRLLGGYQSNEVQNQIRVALNPRLTSAVLGRRIDGNHGGHTRIEMAEVRQIKNDTTRVLHQYLCSLINPGETRELSEAIMRIHVWHLPKQPAKPNKSTKPTCYERTKKQHQRLKKALSELNQLGWQCSALAKSQASTAKQRRDKWSITRPRVLEIEDTAKTIMLTPKKDDRGNPPDLEWLVRRQPARAIRDYESKLTDEQFAVAASKQPTAALKNAGNRLTDEQFARAATAAPKSAMRYSLDRLSDEQFAAAASKQPTAALTHAVQRLTPEQFVVACTTTGEWPIGNPEVKDGQLDAWFEVNPPTALDHVQRVKGINLKSYDDLIQHLPENHLLACAKQWPHGALDKADQLPKGIQAMIPSLAEDNPAGAIEFAYSYLSKHHPETLEACILLAPAAAIRYQLRALDPVQRKYCLVRSPWTARTLHFQQLTPDEIITANAAIDENAIRNAKLIAYECPEFILQQRHKFSKDLISLAEAQSRKYYTK